jgi:hypothetical protein
MNDHDRLAEVVDQAIGRMFTAAREYRDAKALPPSQQIGEADEYWYRRAFVAGMGTLARLTGQEALYERLWAAEMEAYELTVDESAPLSRETQAELADAEASR